MLFAGTTILFASCDSKPTEAAAEVVEGQEVEGGDVETKAATVEVEATTASDTVEVEQ